MHSHGSLHKCTVYSHFICIFLGDQASKLFLTGKEGICLGTWFISMAFHRFILNDLVAVLGLIWAFRNTKTVEQTHVDFAPSQWDVVRRSTDSSAEPEQLYFSCTLQPELIKSVRRVEVISAKHCVRGVCLAWCAEGQEAVLLLTSCWKQY